MLEAAETLASDATLDPDSVSDSTASAAGGSDEEERARLRDMRGLARLVVSLKERLHLLDPRLFNQPLMRQGEIPAANGHFSARALARFYACLGQPLSDGECTPDSKDSPALPRLLPVERLRFISRPHCEERQQTNLYVQGGASTTFGLGFQVYGRLSAASAVVTDATPRRRVEFASDASTADVDMRSVAASVSTSADLLRGLPMSSPSAQVSSAHREEVHDGRGNAAQGHRLPFGHSGFGGSIAFYDPSVDVAVAVTVNQLSQGKGATAALVGEVMRSVGSAPLATF